MKNEELSDLIREAIDKINVQRDWIKKALPWIKWLQDDAKHSPRGEYTAEEIETIDALVAKAPK